MSLISPCSLSAPPPVWFLCSQVSRDSGAELWLADIQEAVKEANQEGQKALKRESEVAEVIGQCKLISSVCVCVQCVWL